MPAPTGRKITSTRVRAPFVPIDPDIDVDQLICENTNFAALPRIDARALTSDEAQRGLELLVQQTVIDEGMPLVIENWHLRSDWPSWMFNDTWLSENHGRDIIPVRDLIEKKETQMTFGHYLDNIRKLANRVNLPRGQRLYAKDLDCPPIWQQTLSSVIPSSTFYLHPKADLMSSLPSSARAENMMCYVGHEGTYTPAHKEMCSSLGQNIMVHTSSGPGYPGSSIWFMTCSADRDMITEYWLSKMGHDIEVEAHFASIKDLQEAPFKVYIHEQKLGDYILIPPLAPHQVWNRGELTIKAAWNRTTVDTLKLALTESLPKARLVCRDEQYKNRNILHETLRKYTRILTGNEDAGGLDWGRIQTDFIKLFNLYHPVLLDEHFSTKLPKPKVEKIDNEYNVQCSFCRGNIWNRFLTCKSCIQTLADGEEDCYDICLDCYARGRSCWCTSNLQWVEQHDWAELLYEYEDFRSAVIQISKPSLADTPPSLEIGLKKLDRKTLARVCQEQLKTRPYTCPNKNGLEDEEESSTVHKKKPKDNPLCHICRVRHSSWKSASCSSCNLSYCFGSLWRAFDMDPFTDVLSQYNWKCPVCRKNCSCGACRKRPNMTPYEPKGTFLGASTTAYRDHRSIESLVDFTQGNLKWVRDVDTEAAAREKKRARESVGGGNDLVVGVDGIPIDPALGMGGDDGGGGGGTPAVKRRALIEVNKCEGRSSFSDHETSPVTAAATGDENDSLMGTNDYVPGKQSSQSAAKNQDDSNNSLQYSGVPLGLISLEQNPLAFIAAAGLQVISVSGQTFQHVPALPQTQQASTQQPPPSPPALAALAALPALPPLPALPAFPTPPIPPIPISKPLPRRLSRLHLVDTLTQSTTHPSPDLLESAQTWALKTKRATKWSNNLRLTPGGRNRICIVVFRFGDVDEYGNPGNSEDPSSGYSITDSFPHPLRDTSDNRDTGEPEPQHPSTRTPLQKFRLLIDAIDTRGMVTTDLIRISTGTLAITKPLQRPTKTKTTTITMDPFTGKRLRGRPRKYVNLDNDDSNDHDHLDLGGREYGGGGEGDKALLGVTEKSVLEKLTAEAKKRREQAYERRKKEEEEATRAHLAAQAAEDHFTDDVDIHNHDDCDDGDRNSALSIAEVSVRKRRQRFVASKREVGGLVGEIVAKRRRISQAMYDDFILPPDPLDVVDVEAFEAAHLAAEEAEKRRWGEELQRKREQEAREAERKRCEEECRKRREEQQRRREERVARKKVAADRNAKMVAAGLASWSDFEDNNDGQSSEPEPEPEPEFEFEPNFYSQQYQVPRTTHYGGFNAKSDDITQHHHHLTEQFGIWPPPPPSQLFDYNFDAYLTGSPTSPGSPTFPDDHNFGFHSFDHHPSSSSSRKRFHPPYGHSSFHHLPFSLATDFAVIIPPPPKGLWRSKYVLAGPISPPPQQAPRQVAHTATKCLLPRNADPDRKFHLGSWISHPTIPERGAKVGQRKHEGSVDLKFESDGEDAGSRRRQCGDRREGRWAGERAQGETQKSRNQEGNVGRS